MRDPKAHAAKSGSVPFMLRGPKSVRTAVSVAVASMIGLVPVVLVDSPASAANGAPKYQLSASSTPVAETATPTTTIVGGVAVPGAPTQKTVTITARLTAAAPDGATIPIIAGTDGDTAMPGDPMNDPEGLRDYDQLAPDPVITIPAGKTSGTTTVTLYDDALDESDTQFFTIRADGSRSGEFVGVGTAVTGADAAKVWITDDEATPTVKIEDADATIEGNQLVFPVTLSGPSEREVTVKATTSNGVTSGDNYGATTPSDYTGFSGRLVTIPATATSALVLVDTDEDGVIEATPERMSVSIANAVNATLGAPTTATGAINDFSEAPSLTVYTEELSDIATSYGPEGNTGETAKYVYVKLSSASTIPVRLNYTFGGSDDTATAGVDYKGTNGTLTIAPGDLLAKIPVSIVGDKISEPGGETFRVVFTSPNGSVAAGSLGEDHAKVLTITDEDDPPTYTLANFGIMEGDSGVTTAKIPVTLSGPVNEDVSLAVTEGDGGSADDTGVNSGSTVGDNDYDAPAAEVLIPAGSTTGYIEVPVNGDVIFEHNDTLNLSIDGQDGLVSNETPSGVSHSAVFTIQNDDVAPTIKFNEVSGSEGTMVPISATIVGQSEYDIPLTFSLGNTGDTATANTDYAFQFGGDPDVDFDYTIERGATPGPLFGGMEGLLYTLLSADNIDEPTEAFTFMAKEAGAGTIGFKQVVGTYKINDDPGDLPPSATVRDATVAGTGGTVDVPVDLAFTSGDATSTTQTVTIAYSTVDGTAKAGTDYTAKTGTLTFAPGELTKNVNVPITNRSRSADKMFYVKLGTAGPMGASVTDGTGDVTVQSGAAGPGTPDTLTIDAPERVIGSISATIRGKGAPNTTVELWGTPMGEDSEFKKIASSRVDEDGEYGFQRWIGEGYRFEVRSGDVKSKEVYVRVQQKPVFVASSNSRGQLTLAVQGSPRASGQTVIVQRMVNGKWQNAWRGTTGNTNQWRTNIKVGSRTKWQLRAFVAGYMPDGVYPGYSSGKWVTIK